MNKTGAPWAVLLVAMALTAGCATGGRTGTLPVVSQPAEAANLTLYRDGSFVGFFATIRVMINGQEVYRLGRNEAYTLTLDPGIYILDYTIGLNECRRAVTIRPRQSQRLRLAANCMIFENRL